METTPDIIRLLEMLDEPEAYSEQEIRDIINKDEETREAYRLMVAARQGYESEKSSTHVEAAWQRFAEKHYPKPSNHSWLKMVAAFIGILFVSGIAFATIRMVRKYQKAEAPQTEQVIKVSKADITKPAATLETDTTTVQPLVFDNIPLEKMLPEIAAHYGVETIFRSEDTRQLRFHFVWNPQADLKNVVSDLNHFERLHVTLKERQLIVE
ncbi:MAG: DUF4974 domain-containing protein [Prevotella sp.]|nr:DUF4974 domain-containing protein [Prevotella sp.]